MQTPGISNRPSELPAKNLEDSSGSITIKKTTLAAAGVSLTVFACGALATSVRVFEMTNSHLVECARKAGDQLNVCMESRLTLAALLLLGGLALSATAAFGAGNVTAAVLQQSQSPATLEGRVSVEQTTSTENKRSRVLA